MFPSTTSDSSDSIISTLSTHHRHRSRSQSRSSSSSRCRPTPNPRSRSETRLFSSIPKTTRSTYDPNHQPNISSSRMIIDNTLIMDHDSSITSTSTTIAAEPDPISNRTTTLNPLKSKNPLLRLSRLLLEDTKIDEIERVGESVMKEDISLVIDTVPHDIDGDTLMLEEDYALFLQQRRPSRPGSRLNPTYQQYSPLSSSSSSSPSPTRSNFTSHSSIIGSPSSPYYSSSSSSLPANNTSMVPSPLSVDLLMGPPFTRSPRSSHYFSHSRTTSPTALTPIPLTQLLKRPRASSLSDSTGPLGPPPTKRVRRPPRNATNTNNNMSINGGYDSSDGSGGIISLPVSPYITTRVGSSLITRSPSTNTTTNANSATASWILNNNNATRQIPQLLNIQGTSLAFARMDLDDDISSSRSHATITTTQGRSSTVASSSTKSHSSITSPRQNSPSPLPNEVTTTNLVSSSYLLDVGSSMVIEASTSTNTNTNTNTNPQTKG